MIAQFIISMVIVIIGYIIIIMIKGILVVLWAYIAHSNAVLDSRERF